MRIKVGSEVEVWVDEAAPPSMCAWRAGTVTWGNGHSYTMKWKDGRPDSTRIRRQFIRPYPPPTRLPANLAAGDFVEVFNDCLWKWAEIMADGGDGRFDVKIVGSIKVLPANRSMLRVRQALREDDRWVVLHKDDQIPVESALPSRPIPGKHGKSKNIGKGGGNYATPAFQSSGKIKRSHCAVDADIVRDVQRFHGKKLRVNEDAAPRYNGNIEVMDVNPSRLYPNKQQEVSNGTDSSSGSSSSSTTSSDSSSSSGSSSSDRAESAGDKDQNAVYLERKYPNNNAAVEPPSSKKEQHSDDRPESRVSSPVANEEELAAMQDEQEEEPHHQVHRLELDAYMSLMKAFHATGSLTWEKVELLTNIRMHLHISNDEHLQVIWRLNGKRGPPKGHYD